MVFILNSVWPKILKVIWALYQNLKYSGILKKILHGFYNKFVKFQRILTNISITLKKLITKN
jgi:hypothetical protein